MAVRAVQHGMAACISVSPSKTQQNGSHVRNAPPSRAMNAAKSTAALYCLIVLPPFKVSAPPATDAQRAPARFDFAAPHETAECGTMRGSMKALVVEDDVSLARLLCSALATAGIDVDCETSAETAIVALNETRYDCAIIDIVLPGSSGIYVAEAIRRLPAAQRPSVIMITAGDSSSIKVLDRAVVKAVMFKPLKVDALVAFVKNL